MNIADRPLSLAVHLRHVASLLTSQSVVYAWNFPHQCNCGLLARSILGITASELSDRLKKLEDNIPPRKDGLRATWKQQSKAYCPISPEIPATDIFATLRAAGLNQTDFDHVEMLSHPELKADWKAPKWHTERLNVIHYFNTWAAKIEAFHAVKTPTDAQLDAVETRPLVGASPRAISS